MSFTFREAGENDRAMWERFVSSRPWASFSQSWAWGEFQKTQGSDVKRILFLDGEEILVAAQLFWNPRRFGLGYWFCARGPVLSDRALENRREVFHLFCEELLNTDFVRRSLFVRFEPMVQLKEAHGLFPLRVLRNHSMSPPATCVMDLTQDEETMLANMHQKTRYHIRLAEKHGVVIREGTGEDIEHFLSLMRDTVERDQFIPKPLPYLKATYEALASSGMARLRLAEFEGKPLVANIEIAYGDTLTYLHGASSSENRHVKAPFLLHWETIKLGKAEGYKKYDFWGCNPLLTSNFYYRKSWEGISRFKEAWGAEHVDLVGTWDLRVNRVLYGLIFPRTIWMG